MTKEGVLFDVAVLLILTLISTGQCPYPLL